MKVYIVTVLYQHKDGRTVEAVAIVGAPSFAVAVELGARAVSEYPHCAEVLGGMCEEMPDGMTPETAEAAVAERAHRPANATVH